MDRKIAEKFVSINGEGIFSGMPAVFIRFSGCNLKCNWCDTRWAADGTSYEVMSDKEIVNYIENTGFTHVTLTGGEPLEQKNLPRLLEMILEDRAMWVEIETNGSKDISDPLSVIYNGRIIINMDYKCHSSGEEDKMQKKNLHLLRYRDCVKFVVADRTDLDEARYIIDEYKLATKCNTFISPVYGRIDPREIVDYIIENQMDNVRLQLQIHKIIWDPNQRGV